MYSMAEDSETGNSVQKEEGAPPVGESDKIKDESGREEDATDGVEKEATNDGQDSVAEVDENNAAGEVDQEESKGADGADDEEDEENGDDEEKSEDEDEHNEEQAEENDDDEEDAVDQGGDNKKRTASTLPPRPVKRARTAYFIFTDEKRPQVQSEHPGEGVAAIARIMGQMWSSLTDEEKDVYQQKAAEEREQVAKEIEEYKAAGGVIEDESGSNATKDPNSLVFPVARIKKICKLDPEVRGISKEAILMITKCAELATAKLGQEAVRVAQIQNRRKLLPEDVSHVCSHREQFLFLKDDIKDLVKQSNSSHTDATKPAAPKKVDAAREAAASGSKPLTSYFGAAKK